MRVHSLELEEGEVGVEVVLVVRELRLEVILEQVDVCAVHSGAQRAGVVADEGEEEKGVVGGDALEGL